MGTPRNFSNTASGASLSADLSAGATSVALNNYSGFPAAPFTATIGRNQPDEEIVLVTAVTGSTATLTRGYDGTTGQAHVAGAPFELTAVAKDFRDASAHVEATGAVHGLTGNIVGDSDVQTMTNKTVKYLKGLATNAAAAFEADNDATQSGKLFRGLAGGVEKFFVDSIGNLTAQALTATTGSFSGALSAVSATLTGSLSAASATITNGITAATATISGLITANGGVTVPTGKKVTLTDAPATGTDAANKSYVDGKTWPTTAISDADSAATTGVTVKRDGSGRAQFADPAAAQDAATKAYVDAAKPVFKVGGGSVTTNASGDFTITHNLGVVPTSVIVQSRQIAGSTAYHAIGTVTATTFSVRSYYNGAAQANATYNVYWRVDA